MRRHGFFLQGSTDFITQSDLSTLPEASYEQTHPSGKNTNRCTDGETHSEDLEGPG